MLRFPDTPFMCLRAGLSDDIDAVIWVKNLDNIDAVFDLNRMIRDSSRA